MYGPLAAAEPGRHHAAVRAGLNAVLDIVERDLTAELDMPYGVRLERARLVDDRAMALALTPDEVTRLISFFSGYNPDAMAELLDDIEGERGSKHEAGQANSAAQGVLAAPDSLDLRVPELPAPAVPVGRCGEHGKVLPHYRCEESERWLDDHASTASSPKTSGGE